VAEARACGKDPGGAWNWMGKARAQAQGARGAGTVRGRFENRFGSIATPGRCGKIANSV